MKIGLTYTGSEEKHNNYVQWLKGNEDIQIIKLSAEENNLSGLMQCDALVLSGGIDIHPKFYNGQLEYKNSPENFNESRDEFELAAFKSSMENNLPVLGICRGMQLVNCALGGNLKQDLEELNMIHKFDNNDKVHGLNIDNGTLLHEIINEPRLVVNSAHHQALGLLGNGLKANCISDDGIAEGIEWIDPSGKPFLLGVQWHPERMFKLQLQHSPLARSIRDRFIKEVKNRLNNYENH